MLLGLPIVGNLLMDLSYRLGGDYATKVKINNRLSDEMALLSFCIL